MAGNILSVDSSSDIIYLHSGFSSTISNSFSSPSSGYTGVADDSWSGVGGGEPAVTTGFMTTNTKFFGG